jgi:BirA family biotin operon repressor/biotin-[acetyl-CoA-carboxylase] ligase
VSGARDGLDAGALEAAVRAELGDGAGSTWFAPITASTNDEAKRAAAAGAKAGSVFVADAQTAGRGRQGRAWHSPAGDNLYLSLLLRPAATPAEVAPFALVVGIAVADAIDGCLGAPRARVKWPNDVWIEGRKIAGVLIEASISAGTVASLVVGVGVNVHTAAFPPELASIATSLAILGAPRRDRAALAGSIARRVVEAGDRFAHGGLAVFRDDLRARDALVDRRIRVEGVEGVARGIDEGGRLVLRTDDGREVPIVAGHVEVLDAAR